MFKSIRLTLVLVLFLSIFYIGVLLLFSTLATSSKGNAAVVVLNGKIVGIENIGQNFSNEKYFWGRPSRAGNGYDGTHSGASNKAVGDKEYLKEVEARIDNFLKYHPYLKRSEVPAELVTASGSGLDPDISPESAYVQAKRVANARNIPLEKVVEVIINKTQKPYWGLIGPSKVNVLELNIALDNMR